MKIKKVFLLGFLFLLCMTGLISTHAVGVQLSNSGFTPLNWGNAGTANFQIPTKTASPNGENYAVLSHGYQCYFTFDLGDTYNICDLWVCLADQGSQTYDITVQYAPPGSSATNWSPTQTTGAGGINPSTDPGVAYQLFSGTKAMTNVRYIRIITNVGGACDLHMYAIRVSRRYNLTEKPFNTVWGESGTTVTMTAGDVANRGCRWHGGIVSRTLSSGAESVFSYRHFANAGVDYLEFTALSYGTATITFTRDNTFEYEPATYTLTINVVRRDPTLSVNPASLTLTYPTAQTLSYTYNGNGTVSVTNNNTGYYTTSHNTSNKTVTATPVAQSDGAAKAFTISSTQTGQYNAKTVTVNVTVVRGTPTITIADAAVTYDANTHTITGSTNSNGALSYVHYLNNGSTQTNTSNSGAGASGGAPKNAGTYKITATSAQTNQYNAASKTVTLTIGKKALTPTANANPKTYDGTTSGSGTISLTGVISGDTVGATATFTFAQKNVGTDITVTASNITLNGASSGNYSVSSTATGKANITVRSVSPSLSAKDKVYDGTIGADGTFSLDNVITGDSVTVSASSITFDNKNVGTGKTVTASGLTLSNSNYILSETTATDTANITACALTPSLAANDKTYDGSKDADGTLSLDGVLPGESVTVSALSITFDDKNVGWDKTVTATGLKLNNNNYVLSSDTATTTADIKPKTLTPHAVANNKTYDTTTNIPEGTLYLEGIVGTDMVELQAASFAFDSALPGNRNAVAAELYLTGADKDNYVLNANTCSVSALIYPHDFVTASCVSYDINTAEAALMQEAIQNKLPFTLPGGCTYEYGKGTFGLATTDYTRTGEFKDALGKITDTFAVDIRLDGIVIVHGNMNVTTGTNTVYGDNRYTEGTLLSSSILKFDTPWTTDASHNASIETATPTDVTFYVYLRQGEKLNVGTKIGLYYGRVDVTVKKGGSEQAKDHIDAFFPVSYEEEYTISDMRSSDVQDSLNPNRGDYWDSVPEFTAATDGLYNVTMHVTGSSYLLDAEKGLGAMYQGNTPADPPETSLRYVTIQ